MKKYEVYVNHGGVVVLVADFYGKGDALMFCKKWNEMEEKAGSDAYYFIGK